MTNKFYMIFVENTANSPKKQNTGIAEIFKNVEYSNSWDIK